MIDLQNLSGTKGVQIIAASLLLGGTKLSSKLLEEYLGVHQGT